MTLATAQHLRSTANFINARPLAVQVIRRTKQATSAGGFRWVTPVAQAPQTIRVVELIRLQARSERIDGAGNLIVPTHIGVTMPDGNFQRYDQFFAYGEDWEVVHISKLPEWRWHLEMVSRGS